MKIKIVFILSTLTGGGAERVTLNIINGLDKSKFDVHLIVLQNYGEYLEQIPDNINKYILNISRTLFSPKILRRMIKDIRPDITYTTLYNTNIAVTLATLGLKNKPKIVLRNPNSPKRVMEQKAMNFFLRYFLTKVYNKADVVIAQTPEMKEELSKYFNVKMKKINIFMNPLDKQKIQQSIENSKNIFDKNKINIVAAGRLSYEKGFDVLIKAFQSIVQQNNNYYLHIIGKDEGEEENIKELISELSLDNFVKLWGFQQNPYSFFKHSDLYVLPSRREGLPNTVLENLYLEIPVVATNCVPFMKTLITDGENGFIVAIEDPINLANKILKHKELTVNSKNTTLDFGNPNTLFTQIHNRI